MTRPGRAVLGLALLACTALAVLTVGARGGPPASPPGPPPAASVAALESLPGPGTAPAAIRIPRLGVASPLVALHVDAAGVLVPPATADVAGWHTAGAVPGEVGPAVVAGHVDARSGPGVFVDVASLRAGDTVEIERVDGEVVTFTVRGLRTVDKDLFPTDAVYGPTPVPELRLVTCGGFFDALDGHYRANVIVDAVREDPGGWDFSG